ncbi:protein-disulfide reductase DsbD domain-containing protein [Histidinibacterium aquaticum]|uniref:Thiol:disulfide interchange protein DsbD N-terminal domain-containing protein n=1 Tax=Histidinibacterium aquaticum TaxID=2613962 RepID=A0A5J5GSN6_9RHOB|nr:protein-disulfide reductase DsbD domain-containing protein [Histidinibacterium aquaticum]KAA9010544.1 hypothetical protein F3S47_04695 [Histidinibacterium aquaticum]
MLRSLFLACGVVAAVSSLSASAESPVPDGVVSARILPGWRDAEGRHMAGLEIALAPGWKTYWRAPGDAGIPPEFQWSTASNVGQMRLHWPVPEVSESNGLRAIGYTGRVVIPMEFSTGSGPARIAGEVELGVCSEVCMPVTLDIAADLPAAGQREPGIVAALLDAPLDESEARVGAVDCRLSATADGMRLEAQLEMPATGGAEEVVIEAADPSIWVSEPASRRQGNTLSVAADLVHYSGGAFALDRSRLVFTVLGSERAVEIRGCD